MPPYALKLGAVFCANPPRSYRSWLPESFGGDWRGTRAPLHSSRRAANSKSVPHSGHCRDTTPVQVQINTVAPALSPEEGEQQITLPVEISVSGLSG
jgi:hypothetical protein